MPSYDTGLSTTMRVRGNATASNSYHDYEGGCGDKNNDDR